jgi:RimJ/RimL family protein N-acetyltransferase
MSIAELAIREMREEDWTFLVELWHNREVMRYADEFPRLRGWSKSDDRESAWAIYRKKRVDQGLDYAQLILRLGDAPIGESFFAPLPEGYTFGRWHKPAGLRCLLGDIKLLPPYWNQGFGTAGMRQVVRFAFTQTECRLFVVPPHRHNPAAERVYEKAGFVLFAGMRSWRNHKIMELTKARFQELYSSTPAADSHAMPNRSSPPTAADR